MGKLMSTHELRVKVNQHPEILEMILEYVKMCQSTEMARVTGQSSKLATLDKMRSDIHSKILTVLGCKDLDCRYHNSVLQMKEKVCECCPLAALYMYCNEIDGRYAA